jgi:hypothetical protein
MTSDATVGRKDQVQFFTMGAGFLKVVRRMEALIDRPFEEGAIAGVMNDQFGQFSALPPTGSDARCGEGVLGVPGSFVAPGGDDDRQRQRRRRTL